MQDIDNICQEFYPLVYKYLLLLTHDEEISKDLTQETFLKAVKKIHTYKGNAKISSWLCEISKNLYYDYLRKNKRNTKEEELKEIPSNENIEISYIRKEENLKICEKIKTLDFLTQRVMYLRIYGEMSFKEIGEVLGKTEIWARVTFYRGKTKVKEDNENE